VLLNRQSRIVIEKPIEDVRRLARGRLSEKIGSAWETVSVEPAQELSADRRPIDHRHPRIVGRDGPWVKDGKSAVRPLAGGHGDGL
jgi:hypothetical protein